MSNSLVNLLHLRSFTQDEVPVNLEAGQLAVNLYNGNNALANGTYNITLFVGTGGTERKSYDGTDLTGDALARAVVTGEPLGVNNGWVRFDLGDLYTPVPGLNLAAAGVSTKKGALDKLDEVIGLLTTLTTTDKTSVVAAINELNQFISQLTAGLQYVGAFDPTTDAITSVSASGTREGYAVGALPAPTDATERHFFIVTVAGTLSGTGNTPSGEVTVGDWIISNGVAWEVLNYESVDPVVSSAAAPTPTPAGPLWVDTTDTDVLGTGPKLHFWDGLAWRELVSDVSDGGVF